MKQILYFSAGWCEACQNMSPLIDQIKKQKNVHVQKIDIDYDGTFVPKYNVKSVPTTILLVNGEETNRAVGTMSLNQLTNFIGK